MPFTIPVAEPTVAIEVLPLVHVPPLVVLLSVAVWPTHKPMLPVMPAGAGFTVIGFVTVQPVPSE